MTDEEADEQLKRFRAMASGDPVIEAAVKVMEHYKMNMDQCRAREQSRTERP